MSALAWQRAFARDPRIAILSIGDGINGIRFTFQPRTWAKPWLCTLVAAYSCVDVCIEFGGGLRFKVASHPFDLRTSTPPADTVDAIGQMLGGECVYGWLAPAAEHGHLGFACGTARRDLYPTPVRTWAKVIAWWRQLIARAFFDRRVIRGGHP